MPGPELSIIVPTFNERGNVAELVRRLDLALNGVAWEAIFVDDNSPDGTAAAVKAIAGRDPRVRCIKRVGRRGLAGACIEGMLSSAAPYVAVIDADLQHDEKVLPAMLARLRHGLSLDGQPLKPAKVDWQNPEQLRFVLTEGKKRQIRRMCEQVGLKVVGLKRIRIGGVVLGKLPVGQWRYLGPGERF